MSRGITQQEVVLSENVGTVSPAFSLNGKTIVAIHCNDGIVAGSLSFQAGPTTSTVADVYKEDGTQLSFDVDAERYIKILPGTLSCMDLMRLVSDADQSSGTITLFVSDL